MYNYNFNDDWFRNMGMNNSIVTSSALFNVIYSYNYGYLYLCWYIQ